MAKVTIVIEDLPDGKVKTEVFPNMKQLFNKNQSGHDYTAAEGYALAAVNRIQQISKQSQPSNKIYIPKYST